MFDEKEMTTPMSSAPTEDGRSSENISTTIIPENEGYFNPSDEEFFEVQMQYEQEQQALAQAERESSRGYMPTVSMSELYEMVYPGKTPLIKNFLYPGTYLFAGAPKIGKSFMMAQLAYHVSSGTPMWGLPVRKGTVLYLALEDDYPRLQSRLYRMFGTDTTSELFFSVTSKTLSKGLFEQLNEFIKEHPDTVLVMIDTLQKVREIEGDNFSYAKDYDFIAALKAFADRTGICLILVHHTRKQKSDDNFDLISGTNGLLGAADGAFIMYKSKRSDSDATIEISGRDQPDRIIDVVRNKKTLCWDIMHEISADDNEPLEPEIEAIGTFINEENLSWKGTATDLIEKLSLDIKPNTLSKKLNVNAGRLYNLYFVKYSKGRNNKKRWIDLSYDTEHPVIVQPEREEVSESDSETDAENDIDGITISEEEFHTSENGLSYSERFISGNGSTQRVFHDMDDDEKENFLATSY